MFTQGSADWNIGTLQEHSRCFSRVIIAIVFSDAGRHHENAQMCFAGLLQDEVKQGATFHLLSWSLHKARRPVSSTGASEILATGKAFDEGKILCSSPSTLYNVQVCLHILVDSKDLFPSLSTQRQSID